MKQRSSKRNRNQKDLSLVVQHHNWIFQNVIHPETEDNARHQKRRETEKLVGKVQGKFF